MKKLDNYLRAIFFVAFCLAIMWIAMGGNP